jgi:hypothetical protein
MKATHNSNNEGSKMETRHYHKSTSREKKLERQAAKKDWYPTAEEFFVWAGKLKAKYNTEEMTNVFHILYP